MRVDAPALRPPHLPQGVWRIEPRRSRAWVPIRLGASRRELEVAPGGHLQARDEDVDLVVTLAPPRRRPDARALRWALFGAPGRHPLVLTAGDPLPLAPPRLFLEGMVTIGEEREEARLDASVLDAPADADLGDRLALEVRCALGSAWDSTPPRLQVGRDARLVLGLSAIKVA